MHALFFAMKRAHHATMRLTRPMLRKVGLTPARFDLLFALFDEDPGRRRRAYGIRRNVPQAALTKILGVCRMTISRMVRSLEELGLLRRRPTRHGSRRLCIELTELGDAKVRRVHRQLMTRGQPDLALDSMLSPTGWYLEDEVVEIKEQLEAALARIRAGSGDVALLRYPWHPDD